MIYLGADHRGFNLKENLKSFLDDLGLKYEDLGNKKYIEDDDYPDFAKLVAKRVALLPEEDRGILICGSGVGVDIAANRYKGIRSGLISSKEMAQSSRHDDNTNVLSLSADYLSEKQAKEIVKTWLETDFAGKERYQRRIDKLDNL